MRILLSYSRRHFDPATRDVEQFEGTSANILARTLYDLLSTYGDVTYIDPSEFGAIAGQKFDLFVGPVSNFADIVGACDVAKSICFAVNMHPAARNNVLTGMVRDHQLPEGALAPWDLVDVADRSRSLEVADHIIAVGNVAVYNSYIAHGVPKDKIKMINYGVGPAADAVSTSRAAPPRFLYLASEIGLRKGYDVVAALATRVIASGADFHLDIVGSPTTKWYRDQVEALADEHSKHVTYHGWLDASGDRFRDVVAGCTFLLAPALEEGQAGTVLDAMRAGVIPIVSTNAGIDFSPLGWLDLDLDSAHNTSVVMDALARSPEEVADLSARTVEHYSEFHEHFEAPLAEAVAGCIGGELYPKMSVVLPIHNKEATIVELLQHLDRAMVAYGNVELHVIFDGCRDRSAELVQEYFGGVRNYPITFETTPDIFEVKTNNIGLKKSTGKYCVIMQDDNYIYDENIFFEAALFLDKDPRAAILGTLAGVNFYPIGTQLSGTGQISMSGMETYWRQDAVTDPQLVHQFFQVDACMRGPLFVRKSFLDDHGYLDETYAPLYMDDMDLGFRAAHHGMKVYCMLADVENAALTMANYDLGQNKRFAEILTRNTQTFYERWSPGAEKNYSRSERIRISGTQRAVTRYEPRVSSAMQLRKRLRGIRRLASFVRHAGRVFDSDYCRQLSRIRPEQHSQWLRAQAEKVPTGAKVVDVGVATAVHRELFAHTNYEHVPAHPLPTAARPGRDFRLDAADGYADAIVCTEGLVTAAFATDVLAEISRVLAPGGRLILATPLAADTGDNAAPGGLNRAWYETALPEKGLRIITLRPNGGLFAHVVEQLWHGRDVVVTAFEGGSAFRKLIARTLQIGVFNIPTLVLHMLEDRWALEEHTAGFLCVAEKPPA
jgi:glycosyltransferase involved in cell wall biosynthesis